VTSQTRALPLCHGTRVRPSGRLPSDRHKPCGSFVLELLLMRRHELLARSKRGPELICWEPFCQQMHGGRMHPLEFHNGTDVERTAPVQAAALWRLSRLRHPTACHKTQLARRITSPRCAVTMLRETKHAERVSSRCFLQADDQRECQNGPKTAV